MAQTPVNNPSTNEDDENYRGLTAYDSLNSGDAVDSSQSGSSLGEEGLTTSRVNRAATDDSGSDADESVEHRGLHADVGNTSELMEDRDAREDASNGAGADAGRPPLRNGDTGYAG